MTFHFRPAKRDHAPLIIGLAGPSKSGKSLSALRMAVGLSGGGQILMLNTEPHGHHYADRFQYSAVDVAPPHRPETYTEILKAAESLKPAVLICDSLTHLWDGAGGMLEYKDEIALQMAKGDRSRAERMNAPAWAEVKAAENAFVYQLLSMHCHVILTFRAKEKIKITKENKWIDLGWRPIMSDRIAFETMFTLMFLPYSAGVPDLTLSELRWPFGEMIPTDRPIDETLGERLAAWANPLDDLALPESTPYIGPSATAPIGTPLDEFVRAFDQAKTEEEARGIWVAAQKVRGSFIASEWACLEAAKAQAKARLT